VVFAEQGKEVLQGYAFVGGVPNYRQAHGECGGKQGAVREAAGAEVLDAGGDEADTFAGFYQREDTGPGAGGVDDVGREAFGRAEGDDAIEEQRSGFAVGDDEALVAEGADVDGLSGEAVVGTRYDVDGVSVEQFGVEDAVEGWFERPGESDVDAAFFQGCELFRGVHLHERESDAGATAAEFSNDAGEKSAGTPEEKSDGERAEFAVEGFSREVNGSVGGFEGLAGLFEEDVTFWGEADGATSAIEEKATDFAFQVEHLLADCGL